MKKPLLLLLVVSMMLWPGPVQVQVATVYVYEIYNPDPVFYHNVSLKIDADLADPGFYYINI